jgi:hypothetical protein
MTYGDQEKIVHHDVPKPCPECGSTHVRWAHSRGAVEKFLCVLGLRIRCCRSCGERYTRLGGAAVRLKDVKKVGRGVLLVIFVLAVPLMVIAVISWLMDHSSTEGDDGVG